MWKNLKIRGKLLSGFGLLLFIFAGAISWSWMGIDSVREGNVFLAQSNVPTMLLTTTIDRDIQDMYLAMRTYQYKELDSDLNSVKNTREKIQKELDTAKVTYTQDSRLKDLQPIVEKVTPAFRTYTENIDKVVSMIAKKSVSYKAVENIGKELSDLAAEIVQEQYKAMEEDATRDTSRVLRRLERLKESVAINVATVDLRGVIQRAIAHGDIEEIQAANAIIENIVAQCKALRQITTQSDRQTPMAKLEATGEEYQRAINDFIKIYVELQGVHQQRVPLVAELDQNSAAGASASQNNVKTIAETSVEDLGNAMWILLASTLVAIVFGLCIAFFIARGIAVPLGTIVRLAERAGEGDLTIERKDFNYEGEDELGTLVNALSNMIVSQENAILEAVLVAENVAEGAQNLSAVSEETNSAMNEIKTSIDQVSALSETNGAALEECNAGVEEMSAGADTVAQSSTDSAAFISQTTEASHKAINTVSDVISGMKDAHETSNLNEEKMKHLVEAVDKIGGFVTVITGIANQTNLLALNAAIEAARAGDAGRGFAVVAEEVRKLAEESARAAQNVNEIIGLLQKSAQESITTTIESGKLLTAMLEQAEKAQNELNVALSEMNKANDSIQNIAAVAEEQAASSREVATAIDSATRTTMEVAETISNIRRSSDTTVEGARNVADQSQAMSQYAQNLKLVLERFKTKETSKPLPAKALHA
ncbi:MAG: methyl-accepting chemotaxis protein [Synergistaceae bacterium]|jgi:methyl-accepting chemotaxis protein|nr:methyl-accepting chemotaxis protein [Synergistaceae bacterium]